MGKILVVDGSLLDRARMTTILAAAGYQILEWDQGRRAMQEMAVMPRGYADLVITELHLPDMSGLELVGWLRAQTNMGSVPAVVVSSETGREQIIAAIAAGAENMLAKPFASDVFLRRITDVLRQFQVVRQGEDGEVAWNVRDYLIRELKRADRSQRPLSLIVGRVGQGGRALSALLAGLGRNLRASDTLTRLAPDLVVVVLPDTDAMGAGVVDAKVWRAMSQLAEDGVSTEGLHLATGTATFPEDGASVDALIAAARDRAQPRSQAAD